MFSEKVYQLNVGTRYQNLCNISNYVHKLQVIVKKANEFPCSLNPNNILNEVHPLKSESPLYPVITVDLFQACSKKKLECALGQQNKFYQCSSRLEWIDTIFSLFLHQWIKASENVCRTFIISRPINLYINASTIRSYLKCLCI